MKTWACVCMAVVFCAAGAGILFAADLEGEEAEQIQEPAVEEAPAGEALVEEPAGGETPAELAYTIDGSLDDWEGQEPIIGEVGRNGTKFANALDIKKMYLKEDDEYYYMFLACKPSVEERWQKSQRSAGFCEIYLNTDNDSSTGCKGEIGFEYGDIDGYEINIWIIVGQQFGSGGSTPYLMYKVRTVGEKGGFSLASEGFEQDSNDKDCLIRYGKDGVEMAVPKKTLGLTEGKKPLFLIKEDANAFDRDGYSSWPEKQ